MIPTVIEWWQGQGHRHGLAGELPLFRETSNGIKAEQEYPDRWSEADVTVRGQAYLAGYAKGEALAEIRALNGGA